MKKIRVLFICVHNSARSQMAQALLLHLAGDRFYAESAGLEPGELNPLAVEVMNEISIDISNNTTDSVFAYSRQKREYDYIITVCDAANAERCPYFPGKAKRLHFGFADPSTFTGTSEEKLAKTREVRNEIKKTLENFIEKIITDN